MPILIILGIVLAVSWVLAEAEMIYDWQTGEGRDHDLQTYGNGSSIDDHQSHSYRDATTLVTPGEIIIRKSPYTL